MYLTLALLLVLCSTLFNLIHSFSEKSPYNQHLPDCDKVSPSTYIKKKTAAKGIVCPMVKDEEGFLSEWVAFYEVQGFDHVIFYDNNSTSSFAELAPWVKSGFVQIRREWWISATNEVKHVPLHKGHKNKYHDMMRIKMLAEQDCKLTALEMGISIFVSLDMDEYLMPSTNAVTVLDELDEWFKSTTRGLALLTKVQFPPTPHILEPIHLLTIEAYQTRYPIDDKMNYYTSVSRKAALRLTDLPDYNKNTTDMMIYCCDFHGCGNYKADKRCPGLIMEETGNISGKHRPWKNTPHIHHYARSLEKYVLKQQTWETASAESSSGYSIYNFLDRQSGWLFDDTAVSWGCQVRAKLQERTGKRDYLRPGDSWYRNPEYGKVVNDPQKRGRNGAAYGKKLGPKEWSSYPPQDFYQRAHKAYTDPEKEVKRKLQEAKDFEDREVENWRRAEK